MARRELSAEGAAVQSRITLSFRKLRSMGYVVMQDVPSQGRWGHRRGAYTRLMKWLGEEASPKTVQKALKTGVVWYPSAETSSFEKYHVSPWIYFEQVTIDGGFTYHGKSRVEIMQDVTAALTEHDLVVESREPPPGPRQIGGSAPYVVVQGVQRQVMEAAEAAYDLGGWEAYQAITRPTARKKKGSEE